MKTCQRIFCTSLQFRQAGRQSSVLGVAVPEPITTIFFFSYSVSECSLCFQLCERTTAWSSCMCYLSGPDNVSVTVTVIILDDSNVLLLPPGWIHCERGHSPSTGARSNASQGYFSLSHLKKPVLDSNCSPLLAVGLLLGQHVYNHCLVFFFSSSLDLPWFGFCFLCSTEPVYLAHDFHKVQK